MAKVKQKGYAQRSKQLDDINIQGNSTCDIPPRSLKATISF